MSLTEPGVPATKVIALRADGGDGRRVESTAIVTEEDDGERGHVIRAGLRLPLLLIGKPHVRPALMLVTPRASSSWLASIS
ncbi:hypothetical protein FHR32_007407 [Streptosporangium album]|uniref:Uncharacterized protein n=1 Tax=Streptosporangium album TaxID=47479 RepID=A0A7W7S3J1_9ACTN|nr:hypothetical protein [Streptosporangium album]MBB4943007.1 hypothetical protein [Streptosporangium album]